MPSRMIVSPLSDDSGFDGRRLLVVVNKVWEADPLEGALSAGPSAVSESYRPRPDSVQFVRVQGTRGMRGYVTAAKDLRTEIWCIEELIPDGADKSSSLEKAKVLSPLLSDPSVRLVIATGTAASSPDIPPWGSTQNGCVAIGRNAFVHDGNPGAEPAKHWPPPAADSVLASALSSSGFAQLLREPDFSTAVGARMLKPPNDPAVNVGTLIDADSVALSDVNVTDSKMYAVADNATFEAFKALHHGGTVAAIDTTLGVIRSCTPEKIPFLFVAGIVNRAYHFGDEVAPRPYAQNFAGAHNAGIAIAFLLREIAAHP
ncbi:MAG: hypothetical protein JWM87_3370 [Candidatus Eremiobacteraeota bacterium]|nr:hypothetical protein [Candidatus Eremiobacteraeota bacterium]